MKLLLLIVFFTSESLAVKLECTLFSTSYDPLNCVFENTVIPTNEPIEYLYMDPGVNTLTISNCSAFTLPANLFANYSSIESLSIDYSGFKQLSPANFKNASHLQYFSTTKNNIAVLKNGIFRNAPLLERLALESSNIKKISVNTFMKLSSLKYLRLYDNLLSTIKVGVLDHLLSLITIDLSNNNFTKITKTMFRKNLKLESINMENNQIVNIEVGSLDNLLILSNLRLIGNKIVAAGMIQVGLYFEYSNNLLQSYYISPLAENVNIENNVIKSLQCGNVSNVRKFYASNNLLTNTTCIRYMDQLLQLDLSYNKIVKLSKTAFSSLHNVNDINLSFNFIKKLTPQIFAPAIDLMYLTVDKMASYKSLSTSIPSLVTLGLSTKSWSCSVLKNVTAVVNSQKVMVKFNQLGETIFTGHFFGPYTENLAGFACQINSTTINTIKKKATFSDMMFR